MLTARQCWSWAVLSVKTVPPFASLHWYKRGQASWGLRKLPKPTATMRLSHCRTLHMGRSSLQNALPLSFVSERVVSRLVLVSLNLTDDASIAATVMRPSMESPTRTIKMSFPLLRNARWSPPWPRYPKKRYCPSHWRACWAASCSGEGDGGAVNATAGGGAGGGGEGGTGARARGFFGGLAPRARRASVGRLARG